MKIKTLMFLLPFMLLGVLSVKAQSQDVGNLDGKDYVDYFLNRGGLIRITNRRTTTSNLTDDGTKTLGVRANVNDLQATRCVMAVRAVFSLPLIISVHPVRHPRRSTSSTVPTILVRHLISTSPRRVISVALPV